MRLLEHIHEIPGNASLLLNVDEFWNSPLLLIGRLACHVRGKFSDLLNEKSL